MILNMNERAHAPIHVEGPGQGGSRAGRVQGRERLNAARVRVRG